MSIVGYVLLAGRTQTQVAARFGVHQSTIQRLHQRYQTTGSVNDRPRMGRPRVTKLRQDRSMRLSHLRKSISDSDGNCLKNSWSPSTEDQFWHRTTSLRSSGLHNRRPYIGPRLARLHRRRRHDWTLIHQRWRAWQWRNTLFTDESKFQIDFCDLHQNVYRPRGERFSDACVYEMNRFGRASIKALVIIVSPHWCSLTMVRVLVRNVTRVEDVLAWRRIAVIEVLRPVVLPYLAAHPWMILQQDNATPQTARMTRNFLQQNST